MIPHLYCLIKERQPRILKQFVLKIQIAAKHTDVEETDSAEVTGRDWEIRKAGEDERNSSAGVISAELS